MERWAWTNNVTMVRADFTAFWDAVLRILPKPNEWRLHQTWRRAVLDAFGELYCQGYTYRSLALLGPTSSADARSENAWLAQLRGENNDLARSDDPNFVPPEAKRALDAIDRSMAQLQR